MKKAQQRKLSFRQLCPMAAAISAILAAPVNAQLEEVLVTAQKRTQTIQDVPSSVSAISADMLEKTNTRDFQ
ncbi:hypothetical protein H2508_04015 [Parahaliea sp. F7430]|uniref:TonB-dependent receptor n=1 Tax=Sediminihaliea albiluteola TaxID=2758564 RepID=A0A7W2TUS5_9GAMM|nr:hypothetical protein [Sediminihaliea albiluteola]MBA6412270.1 hypothetical protein [Sediminihaliea albiluteola]